MQRKLWHTTWNTRVRSPWFWHLSRWREAPPWAATANYSLKWSDMLCLNTPRSHSAFLNQGGIFPPICGGKQKLMAKAGKPAITTYSKIYNSIYKYDWIHKEHRYLRKSNSTKSRDWIKKQKNWRSSKFRDKRALKSSKNIQGGDRS